MLAGAALTLVLLGGLLFGQGRLANGHSAREWITLLGGPERDVATRELRALGPRVLLDLSENVVESRSRSVPTRYFLLWSKLPGWARSRLPNPVSPCLAPLVANRADALAREILDALAAGRDKSRPALPVLEALAGSTNSPYQLKAAFAMWTIRGQRQAMLPLLQAKLARGHSPELNEAIDLAGLIGAASAPLTGDLTRLLANPDIDVARSAASSLGSIGPEARLAVPSLIVAAESLDDALRINARGALARIDPAALLSLPTYEAGN